MKIGVLIVGAATLVALTLVVAFAPGVKDNPLLLMLISGAVAVIPSFFAAMKADESATSVKRVEEKLENGTMTRVVKNAMVSHEKDKQNGT